ncbi:MAG TPA: hypothetical protein VEK08_00945 [Planctomycetota bacterium]|nr:hypothetical protein [Planctomycetota bacterium]
MSAVLKSILSDLRALPAAAAAFLLSRGVLLPLAFGFLLGLSLPPALRGIYPDKVTPVPYALVACTYVFLFAAITTILFWLGSRHLTQWKHFCVWLASVLFIAAGLLGMRLSGGAGLPFLILFLLLGAQAGVLCAGHALLDLIFDRFPGAAMQSTVLLTGIAVTALLWSREPIHLLSQNPAWQESRAADRLTYGVMKLSPPVALATAWHEAGATPDGRQREGSRFDLIRAPLSYEVWIGSYQAVPYPEILPVSETRAGGVHLFRPNLILALLAWALPLLLFGDVLTNRSVLKQPEL